MRKEFCLPFLSLLVVSMTVNAQSDQIVQIEKSVFKFGIGLGYRVNTIGIKDPYILSVDSTLQFQKLPTSAFVISATAVFHLGSTQQPNVLHLSKEGKASLLSLKAYKRRKKKEDFKKFLTDQTGDDNIEESHWSVMVALNVADISSDGASFDTPIDGGVGIGYKIGENLNVGLFGDYSSYRHLKDYYINNYTGKPITVAGQKLSAFDKSSDTYFYSKPIFSLSLKFVVTLGSNPSSTE